MHCRHEFQATDSKGAVGLASDDYNGSIGNMSLYGMSRGEISGKSGWKNVLDRNKKQIMAW